MSTLSILFIENKNISISSFLSVLMFMFLQLLTNMFQEEWDLPKEVLVHFRVLAPLCGDHPVLLCNILQSQAEQVRLCLEFLAEIFYRVL